jgi:hypothetical protein
MTKPLLCLLFGWLVVALPALAQPANDNCSSPTDIVLPAAGFGLGTFTAPVDLDGATVQPGEFFAFPAVSAKSVWFRFVLPTARRGKLQYLDTRGLTQQGTEISVTTYLVDPANPCLPGATQRGLAKLVAVNNYGETENECLSPGTYLVQLATTANVTNTFLQVRLEISDPRVATVIPPHDKPAQAADLGTLAAQPTATTQVRYNVGCHTIDDASEQACPTVPGAADFTQSTWHTFTTGSYLDYLSILLDGVPSSEPVMYRLYEGNARTDFAGLVPVGACELLPSASNRYKVKKFLCEVIRPATTYTLQLLFRRDYGRDDVGVIVRQVGTVASRAPRPVLASLPPASVVTLASGANNFVDAFGCNSFLANNACGTVNPAAGVVVPTSPATSATYTMSTWASVELTAFSDLRITTAIASGPPVYVRVYRRPLTDDCADLTAADLLVQFERNSATLPCLEPGRYAVQFLGRNGTRASAGADNEDDNIFYDSNLGRNFSANFQVTPLPLGDQFGLSAPGRYDALNPDGAGLPQPLGLGTPYFMGLHTFNCRTNPLPALGVCGPTTNRAAYRVFTIGNQATVPAGNPQGGLLTLSMNDVLGQYRLFRGNANTLATAQNTHNFPQTFTGLQEVSACRTDNTTGVYCLIPADYTVASFATDANAGESERANFNSVNYQLVHTLHPSRELAENLGDITDRPSVTSTRDVFSCLDNPATIDGRAPCPIPNFGQATKLIYRQFFISAPKWTVIRSNSDNPADPNVPQARLRLFRGQATDLAQNLAFYADPRWGPNEWDCFTEGETDRCVPLQPGWYTVVAYGAGQSYDTPDQAGQRGFIGFGSTITITFRPQTPDTRFFSRALAENLGDITAQTSVTSQVDYFSCLDNPETIDGLAPCNAGRGEATKLIYREFQLTDARWVQISSNFSSISPFYRPPFRLFRGRASAGDPLTLYRDARPNAGTWDCQRVGNSGECTPLPAGWYTVVVYGQGQSATRDFPLNESFIGHDNTITITLPPPTPAPQYNRPNLAALANNGNPVDWIERGTPAYPDTDELYTLPTENFNCQNDAPLNRFVRDSCNSTNNRIAFYVFTITKRSYVTVQGIAGYQAQVYALNARTQAADFLTTPPLQPCQSGGNAIQLCDLAPGTYTLVILTNDGSISFSVTPQLYVEAAASSRFDHAARAYDFDLMPGDGVWRSGKVGEVNPIDPGRAASNDFFYCTTGAQANDPIDPDNSCAVGVLNPRVYTPGPPNGVLVATNESARPRRNLWYTFVLNNFGTARVRVTGRTNGKNVQLPYAVYRSNVDGNLDFGQVVSTGEVDSTLAQGLTPIIDNRARPINPFFCILTDTVSFVRPLPDPCFDPTIARNRYYIVVDNFAGPFNQLLPNHQVEVEILYDEVPFVRIPRPRYDAFANANVVNGLGQVAAPYTAQPIGLGTYLGAPETYRCATRTPNEATFTASACDRTQWYKFEVNQDFVVQLQYEVVATTQRFRNLDNISLFREVAPGDSTTAGLLRQTLNDFWDTETSSYWAQSCVSAGTYYVMLNGCNDDFVLGSIRPVIKLAPRPRFDHFARPGLFNPGSPLAVGLAYEGPGEKYRCATAPPNEVALLPTGTTCRQVQWYKFTLDRAMAVQFAYRIEGSAFLNYGGANFSLVRETTPGDSTNTGLARLSLTDLLDAGTWWSYSCLTAGTYYLLVNGCNSNFDWYNIIPVVRTTPLPKYDFFNQAGQINAGAPLATQTTYLGDPDLFKCATRTPNEATLTTATCQTTLWYKFTVDRSTPVRLGYRFQTATRTDFDARGIALLRERVPGDSTAAGLQRLTLTAQTDASTGNEWGYTCVTPGTYYVLMNQAAGCGSNLNIPVLPVVRVGSQVKYDFYQNAHALNGGAPLTLSGEYRGDWDDYTCATRTPNDQSPAACQRTVWYKFTLTSSAQVNIAYRRQGDATNRNYAVVNNLSLLQELVPGDSAATGLRRIPLLFNSLTTSGSTCVVAGTYYLMVNGCEDQFLEHQMYPVITLDSRPGDRCGDPVTVSLNSLTTSSAQLNVGCHTMGGDFGEDVNFPNMDCLFGPANYKSSWFVVDVSLPGDPKIDIGFRLIENTDQGANQIRYRVLYGDCGAMTLGPCNTDAGTVFNARCLGSGRYYVQVVSPQDALGSVRLECTASLAADQSCIALDPFAPQAGFDYLLDCATDQVRFNNLSSAGSSMEYEWRTSNGQSSTATNPTFTFPRSAGAVNSYTVTLRARNRNNGQSDEVTLPVRMPPPVAGSLGNDRTVCGASALLEAFAYQNATYRWSTGATTRQVTATASGLYWVEVTLPSGTCAREEVNLTLLRASPVIAQSAPNCGAVELSVNEVAGFSYQWLLNGQPIPGAVGRAHTARRSGSYTVRATGGAGACTEDSAPASLVGLFQDLVVAGRVDITTDREFGSVTIPPGNTLWLADGVQVVVHGDWDNRGVFLANRSTVVLRGCAAQAVGGGPANRFHNLALDNRLGATLTAPASVARLLELREGSLASNGHLTLLSVPGQTAMVAQKADGSNAVTGLATAQRWVEPYPTRPLGLGYTYASSPVRGALVSQLVPDMNLVVYPDYYWQNTKYFSAATFPTGFRYVEGENRVFEGGSDASGQLGWRCLDPAAQIGTGQGLCLNLPANSLIDLTGELHNGNINIPITRGTAPASGWNLLGNPYPSPLNWEAAYFLGNNRDAVQPTTWRRTATARFAGNWATYMAGVGSTNGATAEIAVGQGFFVRALPGTTGTVGLDNTVRPAAYGSPAFLRPEEAEAQGPMATVKLRLSGPAGLSDEAIVHFRPGATAGLDQRHDADKFFNSGPAPNLYTRASGREPLAINGLAPFGGRQAVPLAVQPGQRGAHALEVVADGTRLGGLTATLEDRATGAMHPIGERPFRFEAQASVLDRFVLHLGWPELGPGLAVWPNPVAGEANVLPERFAGAVEVVLANSLGTVLGRQTVPPGGQARFDTRHLPPGVYLLSASDGQQRAEARFVKQ